ncbi:hypothetical protein BC835DRAFT_1358830 [Cytidiella melzeri]|nr:hypothetical protein BC835DRAFT_1358830 [Cytidiella melzeri]
MQSVYPAPQDGAIFGPESASSSQCLHPRPTLSFYDEPVAGQSSLTMKLEQNTFNLPQNNEIGVQLERKANRKITIVACQFCRRRKIRCGGPQVISPTDRACTITNLAARSLFGPSGASMNEDDT